MSKFYIIFKCTGGSPVSSEQCTTAWVPEIKCSIPLSGNVSGDFYNLMVMEGDLGLIEDWVNENGNKVTISSKEEMDLLGQQIVAPNTERVSFDMNTGEKITMKSGYFDIDNPDALWYRVV